MKTTFAALSVPNYRRYVGGQSISLVGTWMQMTAQSWLVFVLTHSSTDLGLVIALQTLPVLLLAPYGGVIADRVDKLRLMICLQTAMGVQALVLGVLTVTGQIRFWEIGVLAVLLGLNNAFENPARQSFMLAGLLIATVGEGVCFLVNAGSFVAVVTTLLHMDRSALRPSPPAPRAAGQLRQGLRYVARTPALRTPLLMMALVGTVAYEFQVSLPVMAQQGLHAGAAGYGFMTAAMGVGAVAGGLLVAARGEIGMRTLIIAASGFGATLLFAALAPSLAIELIALALAGAASITFMSTANSTLQLNAEPSMRGRVMSLWFVAFQGTTPIGGPLIGWVIAMGGARAGLGAGAASCVLAAMLGLIAVRHLRSGAAARGAGALSSPA